MKNIKLNDIINYIVDLENKVIILENENSMLKHESKDDFEFKERYEKILNALKDLIKQNVLCYGIDRYDDYKNYNDYLNKIIDYNHDRIPKNLSKEDMYYICYDMFIPSFEEFLAKVKKEEQEENN